MSGLVAVSSCSGSSVRRTASPSVRSIDAGSPEKTNDLVLDMMVQMYDYMMVPLIREP